MNVVRNYLENMWDEQGVVPALETIEEALDGKVPFEEHANIPAAVERFISFINVEEGEVLYQLPKASAERLQGARNRVEAL